MLAYKYLNEIRNALLSFNFNSAESDSVMQIINNLWSLTIENEINLLFALLTFIFFIFGLIVCCFNTTFCNRVARFTPAILASIGILGTFVGVFNGLYDFDLNNIAPDQDAGARAIEIKKILDGLKTSFVTSIWGILCAVVFRPIVA